MKNILLPIMAVFLGCGPQYARDPNASVLVTSQYEDEPVRIILSDNCNPQLDCSKKSEAECAVALYYDSDKFIKEGKKLLDKKLYISAKVEFMQAMTRLAEAEIRLKRAKTANYQDYQIVTQLNLDKKIKGKIQMCEQLMRAADWR